MYDYKNDDCGVNVWLKPSISSEWTLNPVPLSSNANVVFDLISSGYLRGSGFACNAKRVRPVAFLKSSTTISDALGTEDDPFIAS